MNSLPTNRSFLRGLQVMEALASAGAPMRLTDVVAAVGLDKATTLRLLNTLRAAGYVTQDGEQGRYVLTQRVFLLTRGAVGLRDIREVARPHLERLRTETAETIHLGVLASDQIVYIDKLESTHSIRLVSAIGQAGPLHTTGVGKAMLSFLPEDEAGRLLASLDLTPRTSASMTTLEQVREECAKARRRGYSIDLCENEEDVVCVGAPIVGAGAVPLGAISIAGPAFRMTSKLDDLGRRVSEAAAAIAHEVDGGSAALAASTERS